MFCSSRSHLRTGSTKLGSICGISLLDIIADSSTALGLDVSAATVAVVRRKFLNGAQIQRALEATGSILGDVAAVRVNIRNIERSSRNRGKTRLLCPLVYPPDK